MKNKLERCKQCEKCPWKVSTDPSDIPNGYDIDKHKNLKGTISKGMESLSNAKAMACHETHEGYCVGWLVNQLGVGNNLGLRMRMRNYDLSEVEVFGEQHDNFTDTIKE